MKVRNAEVDRNKRLPISEIKGGQIFKSGNSYYVKSNQGDFFINLVCGRLHCATDYCIGGNALVRLVTKIHLEK